MKHCRLVYAIAWFAFILASPVQAGLAVEEGQGKLEVSNDFVELVFAEKDGQVEIKLAVIRKGGKPQLLCQSFRPAPNQRDKGNKFFDTTVTAHRYQATELAGGFSVVTRNDQQVVVRLTGQDEKIKFTQEFTIEANSPAVHVRLIGELSADQLDYLMSSWEFVSGKPDFVHSPTAKQQHFNASPAQDQVIGDHAFHTPHITLQTGGSFVALIPDLDMINEHVEVSPDARRTQRVARNKFSVPIVDEFYTMPTALDLNAQSGYTENPVFSYGMMDFIVTHHVRYPRVNNASMVRTIPDKEVEIGYTLLVGVDQEPGTSFQQAVRFIWDEYGHRQFKDEAHLAMPFAEYVRTIYGVVSKSMPPSIQKPVPGHEDMGVFVEFELDGRTAGGMVSPLPFYGPCLWNFEFWNNVRDANGLVYWGERLGDKKMAERGRHIINLALSAPRNEAGFFPLVYMPDKKQWLTSTLGPSPSPRHIFHRGKGHVHNVVAMSKSAAHMIEYYKRCEQDQAILDYLRPFADTLVKQIDPRGAIASYYTPDMKPIQDLWHSAQPAAMMWFLAEMASVTGETRYQQGAEKIASYLMKEVLPEARWVDLEVYYSCGQNSLDFLIDLTQNLPIRGNLSIHWASKGFQVLYQVTKDPGHLRAGEIATDYLAQSQGSWNPHYVYTANPFGGCTVDNVDTATWLDARQCELVQPFIWYGLELGRQDLVERGIAAARASTVLINHPRHIENGIYPHVNIYSFGLGPENINHEGHNQSAMRTHPSWGECSGIFTGLADAARFAGGGIVDLKSGIAAGVDGVNLTLEQDGKTAAITATGRLNKLKKKWDKAYALQIHVLQGDTPDKTEALFNGEPVNLAFKDGRAVVDVVVTGEGGVHLAGTAPADPGRPVAPVHAGIAITNPSFETTGAATGNANLALADGWVAENLVTVGGIQNSSAPDGFEGVVDAQTDGSRYLRLVGDVGQDGGVSQQVGSLADGQSVQITGDYFTGGNGGPVIAYAPIIELYSGNPRDSGVVVATAVLKGGALDGATNTTSTFTLDFTAGGGNGADLYLRMRTNSTAPGDNGGRNVVTRGGIDKLQVTLRP